MSIFYTVSNFDYPAISGLIKKLGLIRYYTDLENEYGSKL